MGTTIPAPKFQIGDVVYLSRSYPSEGKVKCPDCKGKRMWLATSPAGYECEFPCPRCKSYGEISTPALHKPYTKLLTIGQVRVEYPATGFGADKGPVSYMARETGVGGGTIYNECDLHATEAEAIAAAQKVADERNAEKVERTDYKREIKLSEWQISDTKIKTAEEEARKYRYAFDHIVNRICELDTHPVSGGVFNSACSITESQRYCIQESLVWLDDEATEALIEYRREVEAPTNG